jgi:hypothetical protein
MPAVAKPALEASSVPPSISYSSMLVAQCPASAASTYTRQLETALAAARS